jgi:mannose-1-phosphate guanylyltransferase
MFIWRVDKVLAEFERQMPKLYQALSSLEKAWGKDEYQETLSKVWDGVEKISIDFGIMEGAQKVAVIPAKGLGWNDVGSWGALFKVLEADQEGNIFNCKNHLSLGSSNSLVHQDSEIDRLVVTLGVEGLVIVDTGDVLLVCAKDQVQDVKQVVNSLYEKGKKEYL